MYCSYNDGDIRIENRDGNTVGNLVEWCLLHVNGSMDFARILYLFYGCCKVAKEREDPL